LQVVRKDLLLKSTFRSTNDASSDDQKDINSRKQSFNINSKQGSMSYTGGMSSLVSFRSVNFTKELELI
jgi:hypothetical protein